VEPVRGVEVLFAENGNLHEWKWVEKAGNNTLMGRLSSVRNVTHQTPVSDRHAG
jgi:hypothetical protein